MCWVNLTALQPKEEETGEIYASLAPDDGSTLRDGRFVKGYFCEDMLHLDDAMQQQAAFGHLPGQGMVDERKNK